MEAAARSRMDSPTPSYFESVGRVRWDIGSLPSDANITRAFLEVSVSPSQSTTSVDNLRLQAVWDDYTAGPTNSDFSHTVPGQRALEASFSAFGDTFVGELSNLNLADWSRDYVSLKFYISQAVDDAAPTDTNQVAFAAEDNPTQPGAKLHLCYNLATRTPTATPTGPTPTPYGVGGASGVLHYHTDHLGSVHAITDASGSVVEYIRYKPYGKIRGRYNAAGGLLLSNNACADGVCREFTGYDTEIISGLQYAGARVYDPELGMFLTHDPARQFANPYTYTGWNPINAVDPNGELAGFCEAAVVAFVIGFAASAINAAIHGANFGEAIKAGAISGAIAAVAAPIASAALGTVAAIYAPTVATASGFTVQQVTQTFFLSVGLAQTGVSGARGDWVGFGIGLGIALNGILDLSQAGRGASAVARDGAVTADGGESFNPTPDDVVKGIEELDLHRQELRFEGLSPAQVGFDPKLPPNQGETHCGLFGACVVTISETFTDRAEFMTTLWHESVHVNEGWFGRLYSVEHLRLVGYDGQVIRAFRTADFGSLSLPATRTGGLNLRVPGPLERVRP